MEGEAFSHWLFTAGMNFEQGNLGESTVRRIRIGINCDNSVYVAYGKSWARFYCKLR